MNRTYRIVVGVDLSEMSQVVLETAFDTAARHDAPELHIVSVLEPPNRLLESAAIAQASELDELEIRLKAMAGENLDNYGVSEDRRASWAIALHSRLGRAAEQIVDVAWEVEADIIIVGRHSKPKRWLSRYGDVPRTVLELTRCPVLVVQPTDYGEYEALDEQRARQCPECVIARRESRGELWFCKQHQDYKLSRRVYMAHSSGSWPIGGGPLL